MLTASIPSAVRRRRRSWVFTESADREKLPRRRIAEHPATWLISWLVELRKSAAGATWCCVCSMRPAVFAGSTAMRCRCSTLLEMWSAFAAWLATSPITACNRNGSHA